MFNERGKYMKTALKLFSILLLGALVSSLVGCASCNPCPKCTTAKKVCVPETKRVAKTDYVTEDKVVCRTEQVRKPRTTWHSETVMKEKTICEPLPVVTPTPCPVEPAPSE